MAATVFFRRLRLTCVTSMLVAAAACPAVAQTPNDEVELSVTSPRAAQVASQVARSVVQVVATAYGTDSLSGVVNMQRLVGAGTIVDEAGYILTSASLVDEAMQVDVVLSGDGSDSGHPASQTMPAALVGIVDELDLAVIRVDASGLPALALARQPVHQGDRTVTVLPGASGAHGAAAGIVLTTGAPVRQDSPVSVVDLLASR